MISPIGSTPIPEQPVHSLKTHSNPATLTLRYIAPPEKPKAIEAKAADLLLLPKITNRPIEHMIAQFMRAGLPLDAPHASAKLMAQFASLVELPMGEYHRLTQQLATLDRSIAKTARLTETLEKPVQKKEEPHKGSPLSQEIVATHAEHAFMQALPLLLKNNYER